MIVNIAHFCVTAWQRVPLWRCLTLMYGILKEECTDFPKTSQALQNSRASRVPWRKYHTEDLQLLDANVQNSDARATRRPRFVRRWLRNHSVSFLCITRPYRVIQSLLYSLSKDYVFSFVSPGHTGWYSHCCTLCPKIMFLSFVSPGHTGWYSHCCTLCPKIMFLSFVSPDHTGWYSHFCTLCPEIIFLSFVSPDHTGWYSHCCTLCPKIMFFSFVSPGHTGWYSHCCTLCPKIMFWRKRRCREEKKGHEYACGGAANRFCFSTVRVLDQGSLLGTGRPLLLWQLDEC